MGLAFYYISRCQNTQPKVAHLNIIQKRPNQSLQLDNIKSLSNKLTESEKYHYNIRIAHPDWGMGILFYYLPSSSFFY